MACPQFNILNIKSYKKNSVFFESDARKKKSHEKKKIHSSMAYFINSVWLASG